MRVYIIEGPKGEGYLFLTNIVPEKGTRVLEMYELKSQDFLEGIFEDYDGFLVFQSEKIAQEIHDYLLLVDPPNQPLVFVD